MSATLGDILRRAEKVLDYTQWIDRSIRGGAAECPWCHSNNGYHRANCELASVLDDIIAMNKAIKTDATEFKLWDTERPVFPGWYWVKVILGGVAQSTIVVRFPGIQDGKGHWYVFHEGTEIPVEDILCWSGPLAAPRTQEE